MAELSENIRENINKVLEDTNNLPSMEFLSNLEEFGYKYHLTRSKKHLIPLIEKINVRHCFPVNVRRQMREEALREEEEKKLWEKQKQDNLNAINLSNFYEGFETGETDGRFTGWYDGLSDKEQGKTFNPQINTLKDENRDDFWNNGYNAGFEIGYKQEYEISYVCAKVLKTPTQQQSPLVSCKKIKRKLSFSSCFNDSIDSFNESPIIPIENLKKRLTFSDISNSF